LKKITFAEVEYLIKNGYVKSEKGKFPSLPTVNRGAKSKKKQRYTEDPIYYKYLKGKNIV